MGSINMSSNGTSSGPEAQQHNTASTAQNRINMSSNGTSRRRHLVVLQHGLGGTATNMLSLYRTISAELPALSHEFKLLNSSCNEGLGKSIEGIRVCGERLFHAII